MGTPRHRGLFVPPNLKIPHSNENFYDFLENAAAGAIYAVETQESRML